MESCDCVATAVGGNMPHLLPTLNQGFTGSNSRWSPMLPSTPVVFVVDDDASVRRSLALLIESGGWHPETFACARDFLSCPAVLAPSCLVLDVTLPDLDGLELQKRLAVERTTMTREPPRTHTCQRLTERPAFLTWRRS